MGDLDSGNSGSLQSSSGAEEEYDSSRADSFSYLFNHHQMSFFDPVSTYFDPNPNPVWVKQPNPIIPSHPTPPDQFPAAAPSSSTTDKQVSARHPRKRTRASRRAPTTVLTTNTSNFRAMVQEFTGIPAPPFGSQTASSNSLFFPRTRFDLFGNTRGAMDAPAPPYLLRPLPQKLQNPTTTATTNKSGDGIAQVMVATSSGGGNTYHVDLGMLKPAPIGGSLELPVTIRNIISGNAGGGLGNIGFAHQQIG